MLAGRLAGRTAQPHHVCDTGRVQAYTVASGIIVDDGQVVFVQNRRRNGSLDWSTPGGVVDPGEQILEALGREVVEETALTVAGWSPMLYSVDVDFVGRDLTLHAQVFVAQGYDGSLHIDDPDEVVVDGRWVDHGEALNLLDHSPQWVAQPLRHALDRVFNAGAASNAPAGAETARWRYDVTGGPGGFSATLLDGPSQP